MYTSKLNRIQISLREEPVCYLLKKVYMLTDKYYIFNYYLQHSMMALLCACFNCVSYLLSYKTRVSTLT